MGKAAGDAQGYVAEAHLIPDYGMVAEQVMTRETAGDTDRWVLLPGTLCTDRVFDPLLDNLGIRHGNRRFVAVDAPDVRNFGARLKAAVTGGEIVCGFSLGALVLAHNLGVLGAARALVLLACSPFPDPPGNRANREAVRDRVLGGDARGWISENWTAMSASHDTALRDFVVSMAESTTDLIMAQTELAASRPSSEKLLKDTELPLIFVTGSEDRLTPADSIREIVAEAKLAHLSVVDGLGHFALIEAPERVAAAVRIGLEAVAPTSLLDRQLHETRDHASLAS